MSNYFKGCLFVISSAVIFGCMPLGAKFIYANGVNAISLAFYRNLLAIPVMYLIVRASRESLKVCRGDFIKLVLLSILECVLTPTLMYSSYNYISSGTATTLHFIYPAVVILVETLFFREKLRMKQLLCVILCLVGVTMFYSPGGNLDPFGSALAILSGITYASYIVLLSKFHLEHISCFKFSL